MSVNQAARQKSALLNIIKHDDFLKLPVWYREYVRRLCLVSSAKTPTAIFSLSDTLLGYLCGLAYANVISDVSYQNLSKLVFVAQDFALENNCKKAA